MDIASTTTFNTNSNTPTAKSPDQEPDPAQTRPIQSPKPQYLTNGVLKRNSSLHHHHHRLSAPIPVVITYKECLKNHAAALGYHALDGCGEFMPSPTATHTDPTSLKCAACGCHRNFHRRDPEDPGPHPTPTIEYQSHHRHHPPPPPSQIPPPYRSPNSSSPPPISSAYPSAPHMLLALSTGLTDSGLTAPGTGSSSRKRFRTKFSQTQKEKMYEFAERVGWKMQKRDEELVQDFCNQVGVDRTVFKVWMHNNKTALGKKDMNGDNGRANVVDQTVHGPDHQHFENHGLAAHNGSSSSS